MFMRVHKKGEEVVVALCDAELLGKILKEGEIVLDLQTYGAFYKGEKVNEVKAAEELKKATSINAVGKKAVAIVQEALGFPEENVKLIEGVPHVQAYKV